MTDPAQSSASEPPTDPEANDAQPPESADRPRRAWRGYVLLLAALLLIKVLVLGWGVYAARNGELSLRDYEQNFHHHRIIARYKDPSHIEFFELWVSSDPQWYFAIAEEGYPSREAFLEPEHPSTPKLIDESHPQLKYAFFPAWPLVIRFVQLMIPDVNAAGFFGANFCHLLAALMLYGFLKGHAGSRTAFWSVVLMSASPFAMFLHVPFTESLFLLLTVLSFVACHHRRWALAGVCIGLCMVTRPTGVSLLVLPPAYLLIDVYRQRRWSWPAAGRMMWVLVAAIPMGVMMWHYAERTGDPMYFLRATWWGYHERDMLGNLFHNTYETLRAYPDLPFHGFHRSQLDFITLVVSLLLLLLGARIIPLPFTVFAGAALLIPLITKNDLMSFSRYAMIAWPLFYAPVVAVRDEFRRWVFGSLSAILLIAQMAGMREFVNWHWVA